MLEPLVIPDAYERACDGMPFSNSDHGESWMEDWCYRCTHDGAGLGLDQPQCPLITVALCNRVPAEWIDSDGQYACLMFRDRDDPGGGREPVPVPDPPGMDALFPREHYEAGRVYLDMVSQEFPEPLAVA